VASNTVHREVNATSSANITATTPNRRRIGWFTARSSFQLPQFEAADQRRGIAFGAKRMVEQRVAARGRDGGGAHAGYEVAGVQRDVARQPERNAAVERDQPARVGAD